MKIQLTHGQKFLQFAQAIFLIIVFLASIIRFMEPLREEIELIQTKVLYSNGELVALIPSVFSKFIAMEIIILLFLTFSFIFMLFTNKYLNIWTQKERSIEVRYYKFVPLFFSLVILSSFFSTTGFYANKIIVKNVLNIKGLQYKYNDIKRIEIEIERSAKYKDTIHYNIIMKDMKKIDIGTEKSKINIIEEYVPAEVPHYISKDNFDIISANKLNLNEKIKRKFIE